MFFIFCLDGRLFKVFKKYRNRNMFVFLWDYFGRSKEVGWEEEGKSGEGVEGWIIIVVV